MPEEGLTLFVSGKDELDTKLIKCHLACRSEPGLKTLVLGFPPWPFLKRGIVLDDSRLGHLLRKPTAHGVLCLRMAAERSPKYP